MSESHRRHCLVPEKIQDRVSITMTKEDIILKKQAILSQLKENVLFSVIIGESAEEAINVSKAVYRDGI